MFKFPYKNEYVIGLTHEEIDKVLPYLMYTNYIETQHAGFGTPQLFVYLKFLDVSLRSVGLKPVSIVNKKWQQDYEQVLADQIVVVGDAALADHSFIIISGLAMKVFASENDWFDKFTFLNRRLRHRPHNPEDMDITLRLVNLLSWNDGAYGGASYGVIPPEVFNTHWEFFAPKIFTFVDCSAWRARVQTGLSWMIPGKSNKFFQKFFHLRDEVCDVSEL